MKKVILSTLIVLIGMAGVYAGTVYKETEKEFILSFPESTLNKHWAKLNETKRLLNESNLPHQQVVFMIASIDSLQQEIRNQVSLQLETEKSKLPKK